MVRGQRGEVLGRHDLVVVECQHRAARLRGLSQFGSGRVEHCVARSGLRAVRGAQRRASLEGVPRRDAGGADAARRGEAEPHRAGDGGGPNVVYYRVAREANGARRAVLQRAAQQRAQPSMGVNRLWTRPTVVNVRGGAAVAEVVAFDGLLARAEAGNQ